MTSIRASLFKTTVVALCSILAATPLVQAAVTIGQSPLILQKPIPPNLVLMLDDSGSMAWNYMPDWDYLKNNNDNDALIDSSNNGVYYDTTVTYNPPIMADGTHYTSYTNITSVPSDGFTTDSSVNLTDYSEGGISYSATAGQKKNRVRVFQYSTGPAAGPYSVHYVASTNCGTFSPCVLASDTSGAAAPAGIAAGTNIANWFAYYHTRILMAKSGLTLAFSGLDRNYRFGFASINGRNNAK
ncbi:MAG: hypothetical protein PHO64_12075, partial [Thiomonas sp.]|nr:hypothetical protein [Thiomonas sp.]